MDLFRDAFTPEAANQALEVLVKLGIAAILGGAIGWEREMHGRPAGVRTHMLVVIGVTLFSELSRQFGGDQGRVAAQVVTGIGFLGAGTILRMGVEIRGLTTAASIWAVAAIGMAVSVGGPFLIVAAAATALALLTLTVVDNVERFFAPQGHPRMCQVEIASPEDLNDVLDELERVGAKFGSLRVVSTNPHVLQIAIRGKQDRVSTALAGLGGVRRVDWMEPGA